MTTDLHMSLCFGEIPSLQLLDERGRIAQPITSDNVLALMRPVEVQMDFPMLLPISAAEFEGASMVICARPYVHEAQIEPLQIALWRAL